MDLNVANEKIVGRIRAAERRARSAKGPKGTAAHTNHAEGLREALLMINEDGSSSDQIIARVNSGPMSRTSEQADGDRRNVIETNHEVFSEEEARPHRRTPPARKGGKR